MAGTTAFGDWYKFLELTHAIVTIRIQIGYLTKQLIDFCSNNKLRRKAERCTSGP